MISGSGGVQKVNEQARDLVKLLCKKLESMSYREATVIANDAILIAPRLGIRHVVEMIVDAFRDATYAAVAGSGQLIFHVAVENRSEDVYNLIYQSDLQYIDTEAVDNDGNSLLHAAGKLGPSVKLNQISGAALQMQRELQWYKVRVEPTLHN